MSDRSPDEVWDAIYDLQKEIRDLSQNVALISQEIAFFRKGVYILITIAGASLGIDAGLM